MICYFRHPLGYSKYPPRIKGAGDDKYSALNCTLEENHQIFGEQDKYNRVRQISQR